MWRIANFLLVAMVLSCPPAWADEMEVTQPLEEEIAVAPKSSEQIKLSFAPVVKQVAPAVVNIYASKIVQRRVPSSPLMNDPFFQRFFERNFGGRVQQQNSLGSGVIVREDGLILTNDHVIGDANNIRVVLADRREFKAEVITSDPETDLAVLKLIDFDEQLPYLTLADSDKIEVGDLVLAIGNPFGVGQTVTSGIVSAVARSADTVSDYNFFIQTDAAINPGNSGGALVDLNGHLVGVNTAIYSRSGGSLGIGFAIPSNLVQTVIVAAETGAGVIRPWLGFDAQTIDPDLAVALGFDRPKGVLIGRIHSLSSASKAGLETGDILLEVDGQEITSLEDLRFRIGTKQLLSDVKLSYLRDGELKTASITLIAPPEIPEKDERILDGVHPFAGAKIANMSPRLAQELSLKSELEGVVVLEVPRDSLARRIKLQRGDTILRVNGEEVTSTKQLQALMARKTNSWVISVRRDDEVITAKIRR